MGENETKIIFAQLNVIMTLLNAILYFNRNQMSEICEMQILLAEPMDNEQLRDRMSVRLCWSSAAM